MLSGDLYDYFKSDVVDLEDPPLWTEAETFLYMNDAYRMFVRLTGGIPDSTSLLTQVPIQSGTAFADVDPRILRFRLAYKVSNGEELVIVNQEELHNLTRSDYGVVRPLVIDNSAGAVQYMVVGQERNMVRWVQIPVVDDTAQISVYRLPLDTIDEGDMGFAFPEIGEEHHEHLSLWMKHRAYSKQDAETFDRGRAADNKKQFEDYCAASKAEWERYKHKTRVVSYGGL